MSHNGTVVECDIRLTYIEQESEVCINQILCTNQNKARRKRTQELNIK